MRRALFIVALLLALPVAAAEVEVAAQHVVVSAMGDSGALDIKLSRGFGASAEVFWRDAFSTRVAATFVNPEAILFPENPPPNDVDLGTLGLDIYSATARFNVAPHARLSGFVGAGGAIAQIGDLDDQFGDDVEVEFDASTAFVAEGGLRYRVREHVVFELGVAYMPLEAKAKARRVSDPRIGVPRTLAIDPVVVSVGAGWCF